MSFSRALQFNPAEATSFTSTVQPDSGGPGRKSTFDWSYLTAKKLVLTQTATKSDATNTSIDDRLAIDLTKDGVGQTNLRGINRTLALYVIPKTTSVTLGGSPKLSVWLNAAWVDVALKTDGNPVSTDVVSGVDEANKWQLYTQLTPGTNGGAFVLTGLPAGVYKVALTAGTWTGTIYIVEQHNE